MRQIYEKPLLGVTILLSVLVFNNSCNDEAETVNGINSLTNNEVSSGETGQLTSSEIWNTEVGSKISYDVAKRWIRNYEEKNAKAIESGEVMKSFFMGKNTFLEILENEGCVGISIINAIGDNGEPKIVLVGITKDGKIMASSLSNNLMGDDPAYSDDTFPCKPFCPTEE